MDKPNSFGAFVSVPRRSERSDDRVQPAQQHGPPREQMPREPTFLQQRGHNDLSASYRTQFVAESSQQRQERSLASLFDTVDNMNRHVLDAATFRAPTAIFNTPTSAPRSALPPAPRSASSDASSRSDAVARAPPRSGCPQEPPRSGTNTAGAHEGTLAADEEHYDRRAAAIQAEMLSEDSTAAGGSAMAASTAQPAATVETPQVARERPSVEQHQAAPPPPAKSGRQVIAEGATTLTNAIRSIVQAPEGCMESPGEELPPLPKKAKRSSILPRGTTFDEAHHQPSTLADSSSHLTLSALAPRHPTQPQPLNPNPTIHTSVSHPSTRHGQHAAQDQARLNTAWTWGARTPRR